MRNLILYLLYVLFFSMLSLCIPVYNPNRLGSDLQLPSPRICLDIIRNNTLWNEWNTCSTRCGKGKEISYLNTKGKGYAKEWKCHLTQRSRSCQGKKCQEKNQPKFYRFIFVSSAFIVTAYITLYYMKRKRNYQYYQPLKSKEKVVEEDEETPGLLDDDENCGFQENERF